MSPARSRMAPRLHSTTLFLLFFPFFSFERISFLSLTAPRSFQLGRWKDWQQRFSSSHHPSSVLSGEIQGDQPANVERSSLVPKVDRTHGVQVQFIDGTWKTPNKEHQRQLTSGQQLRSSSLVNLILGRIAIGQTAVSKETMAVMLLERRADITYNGTRYMAIST